VRAAGASRPDDPLKLFLYSGDLQGASHSLAIALAIAIPLALAIEIAVAVKTGWDCKFLPRVTPNGLSLAIAIGFALEIAVAVETGRDFKSLPQRGSESHDGARDRLYSRPAGGQPFNSRHLASLSQGKVGEAPKRDAKSRSDLRGSALGDSKSLPHAQSQSKWVGIANPSRTRVYERQRVTA
jgi:hypothetical protein